MADPTPCQDFKTIADFRRDNRKAIQQVCREFTLFCRNLELFSGDRIAIDGSKTFMAFIGVTARSESAKSRELEFVGGPTKERVDSTGNYSSPF